jgi:hypothetical protein
MVRRRGEGGPIRRGSTPYQHWQIVRVVSALKRPREKHRVKIGLDQCL